MFATLVVALFALLISGCGSGGGSSVTTPTPPVVIEKAVIALDVRFPIAAREGEETEEESAREAKMVTANPVTNYVQIIVTPYGSTERVTVGVGRDGNVLNITPSTLGVTAVAESAGANTWRVTIGGLQPFDAGSASAWNGEIAYRSADGTEVASRTVLTLGSLAGGVTVTIAGDAIHDYPVVVAAVDQSSCYTGDTVNISCQAGYDNNPGSGEFVYEWEAVQVPEGASIADPSASNTTIVATIVSDYSARCRAIDDGGNGLSSAWSDTISFHAEEIIEGQNNPPLANAGANLSVETGTQANLNGGGSSDPDIGDVITHIWTQISGPTVALTGANTVTPSFTPVEAGIYVFQLVVNDGELDSVIPDSVTVTVTDPVIPNQPPVANAGTNQVATLANGTATVTVDGSGSNDPDGGPNPPTYLWTGSNCTIGSPMAVSTTITCTVAGQYDFQLRVYDGEADNTDTVRVTIQAAGVVTHPPTASITASGTKVTPSIGVTVTVAGNPNDANQTVACALTQSGTGVVTLSSTTTCGDITVGFQTGGTVTITATVTDPDGSDTDTTTLVVNTPPVAAATVNPTTQLVGQNVVIDSASTDVESNILACLWSQVSGPTASITNPSSCSTTFSASSRGTVVLKLTINDGMDTASINTQAVIHDRPIANAGVDQTPIVGTIVNLTSTGSYDPDGGDLDSCIWTRASGLELTIDGATQCVGATINMTSLGSITVSLIVTDDEGVSSVADTVILTATNNNPVADAGDPRQVLVGATVNLDGSGSHDPDPGQGVTYNWTLAVPSGSSATLTGVTTTTPSFVADKAGVYTATVTVADQYGGTDSAEVAITVTNTAPEANAGADLNNVVAGLTVRPDGSDSIDNDGQDLVYEWALTTRPDGSSAALTNATSVTPTFLADKVGIFVATLTVSDGFDTDTDTVSVSVINHNPVVNAGTDVVAETESVVGLSAIANDTDPGQSISYLWEIVSEPEGSTAVLADADTATPDFTTGVTGSYTIRCTVSDQYGGSSSDELVIQTSNTPTAVITAGTGAIIRPGNSGSVDGSGSSAGDQGETVTYLWSAMPGNPDSKYTLSGTTSAILSVAFDADAHGLYCYKLTVGDGFFTATAEPTQQNQCLLVNRQPVAYAGTDADEVPTGATYSFSSGGYTCIDPDVGDTVTRSWVAVTDGAPAVLNGGHAINAGILPTEHGQFTYQFSCHDEHEEAGTNDEVTLTINNPTVIDDGRVETVPEIHINLGDTVTIPVTYTDANVANGQTLICDWPAGQQQNAQLTWAGPAACTNKPTIAPAETTDTLVFQAKVTDDLGHIYTQNISVHIVVNNPVVVAVTDPYVYYTYVDQLPASWEEAGGVQFLTTGRKDTFVDWIGYRVDGQNPAATSNTQLVENCKATNCGVASGMSWPITYGQLYTADYVGYGGLISGFTGLNSLNKLYLYPQQPFVNQTWDSLQIVLQEEDEEDTKMSFFVFNNSSNGVAYPVWNLTEGDVGQYTMVCTLTAPLAVVAGSQREFVDFTCANGTSNNFQLLGITIDNNDLENLSLYSSSHQLLAQNSSGMLSISSPPTISAGGSATFRVKGDLGSGQNAVRLMSYFYTTSGGTDALNRAEIQWRYPVTIALP